MGRWTEFVVLNTTKVVRIIFFYNYFLIYEQNINGYILSKLLINSEVVWFEKKIKNKDVKTSLFICIYYKSIHNFAAPNTHAAGVVKLVDIPDLGSGAARHGGSSPSARTFSGRRP